MVTNARDLCQQLMLADTEEEVVGVLTEAGYWHDARYWRQLGDLENNFSTAGNQQAEAIAALIEKIINGVDARLTNACLLAGIDPASPEAPQSIREAVAYFFESEASRHSDRAGRVALWDDTKTTNEGQLLTVAATGNAPSAGWPSLSIADGGEGQTPDSFPDTFMSLHRSNKLRIPFVQGKFNMGGTGALQFCSENYRFQLVISRRNPALLPPDASPRDHEWGFTIVRRQLPPGNERSSIFTYLAPVGVSEEPRRGAVLAFPADDWPIFPESDATDRSAYLRSAMYGSLVKLYEYRWQGTKSTIVQGKDHLLGRLDQGLPELALPVRIYECRPKYRGHSGSFDTNLLGLSARLERDRAEKIEGDFPVSSTIEVAGRKIRAKVFAFKPKEAKKYRTSRNGVIFTVNGQSHATLSTDFFSRKRVNMNYLADSLLVLVDCSEIDGGMREDLFMNSRDRLRDSSISERLVTELEKFIRDHPQLRELRNRRRQEDLDNRLSNDKPLAEALQEILRRSPSLERLFLRGQHVPSPFPPDGVGQKGGSKFQGKPHPTYFRFKGKSQEHVLHRPAYRGSRSRIPFETDAEDAYFVRDLDPGDWTVWHVHEDRTSVKIYGARMDGPHQGIATLHLPLPSDAVEGDELVVEVEVGEETRVDPFVNRLVLKVLGPASPSSGGSGEASKGGNKGKGAAGTAGGLDLPTVTRVQKKDWEKYSFHTFTPGDALIIVQAEGGSTKSTFDFYVNVDNKYLRTAQKESREDPRLLQEKFVHCMVLAGLALLLEWREGNTTSSSEGKPGNEDVKERFVAQVTSALAPVILPLVDVVASLSSDDFPE